MPIPNPFDNPLEFEPMHYIVDLEIKTVLIDLADTVPIGANAKAQVALNDRPFILQRITHQIKPQWIGTALSVQDGAYYLDWSLYEQIRYWKGALPLANVLTGSIAAGQVLDLPGPVPLTGNQTLHVTMTNALTRIFPLPDVFSVQVQFHGVQRRLIERMAERQG